MKTSIAKRIIVHLKHVFNGKYTCLLMPWGAVACHGVSWGAIYGHGGHLSHVTQLICIIFIPILPLVYMDGHTVPRTAAMDTFP